MTDSALASGDTAIISPSSTTGQQPYAKWVELVDHIRRDEKVGMEELYNVLSKGVRYYLYRQIGPQDLDDRVHECFLHVVDAIKRGTLREPERLMGFVRTIVNRVAIQHIDTLVRRRREANIDNAAPIVDSRQDPTDVLSLSQRKDLIQRVLSELSERDREILRRFYVEEESVEQICTAMDLTSTQFRLLKSRAKARFGEVGKKKIVVHASKLNIAVA